MGILAKAELERVRTADEARERERRQRGTLPI